MDDLSVRRHRREARRALVLKGRAQYSSADRWLVASILDIRLTALDFPRTAKKAWQDIIARYKSSVLGPMWMTIGTLIFVVGFSVVGAIIFGLPADQRGPYTAYLASSVLWWTFIISSMNTASAVFVTQKAFIKSMREPLLSYPVRIVMHQLYTYLHGLPIILGVSWLNGMLNWNAIWAIPAIILVMFGFVGINAFLAVAGARLRDVSQAIITSSTFLFYLTPVLWDQSLVLQSEHKILHLIIYLNPFYYLLEPVRRPLVGEPVELWVWAGCAFICISSFVFGMAIFIRWRRRIAYWV